MEASVQSATAREADEAPDVRAGAGEAERDGPLLVGAADAVGSLGDADEHPVINASTVPPQETESATLLTVVLITMDLQGRWARA